MHVDTTRIGWIEEAIKDSLWEHCPDSTPHLEEDQNLVNARFVYARAAAESLMTQLTSQTLSIAPDLGLERTVYMPHNPPISEGQISLGSDLYLRRDSVQRQRQGVKGVLGKLAGRGAVSVPKRYDFVFAPVRTNAAEISATDDTSHNIGIVKGVITPALKPPYINSRITVLKLSEFVDDIEWLQRRHSDLVLPDIAETVGIGLEKLKTQHP